MTIDERRMLLILMLTVSSSPPEMQRRMAEAAANVFDCDTTEGYLYLAALITRLTGEEL